MPEQTDTPLSPEVEAALDEIDRILRQMLTLAELSAGEGAVDRTNLQVVLEHLQRKIDGIADRMQG